MFDCWERHTHEVVTATYLSFAVKPVPIAALFPDASQELSGKETSLSSPPQLHQKHPLVEQVLGFPCEGS